LASTFSVPADALVRVIRKNATTMRTVVAEREAFFTSIGCLQKKAAVDGGTPGQRRDFPDYSERTIIPRATAVRKLSGAKLSAWAIFFEILVKLAGP
jgi:hypothetical protein